MSLNAGPRSLSDFTRNAPEFVRQMLESGEPILLTIDGKAALVVQDAGSYQRLLDLAEESETMEGIRRGLEDMRAGRTQPFEDAFADVRRGLDSSEGV